MKTWRGNVVWNLIKALTALAVMGQHLWVGEIECRPRYQTCVIEVSLLPWRPGNLQGAQHRNGERMPVPWCSAGACLNWASEGESCSNDVARLGTWLATLLLQIRHPSTGAPAADLPIAPYYLMPVPVGL